MTEKARVLIVSDIHYSRDSLSEEKRWYPESVRLIEYFSKRLARRFLKFCDNYTQKHFRDFIDHIKDKKYDAVICLGDMTPGVTESGLVTKKSQGEALELKARLEKAVGAPVHYVLGNHDLGYFFLSGNKKGGPSAKTIAVASEIYQTSPFYSFTIDDYRFVALTDTLINYKKKKEFDILRNEQFEFLKKELENSERVFLLIHGPFALNDKKLEKIIKANQEKIQGIFCGHAHTSLSKYFVAPGVPFPKELVMVPSLIGFFFFMGFVRGYTELSIGNPSSKWEHKKF